MKLDRAKADQDRFAANAGIIEDEFKASKKPARKSAELDKNLDEEELSEED